ncbi:MAG: replication-relaxation family protein [Chloroflexi bacterium]|nr:replication-relaxation family protein [Chloroflexota bacterium]
MRLGARPLAVLRQLVETPFADRLELAAFSGLPDRTVYRAAARLVRDGLAAWLPHATPLVPFTRRYYATPDGLRQLAFEQGMRPEDLLLDNPLSAEWQRALLERLDGAAGIYRLAAAIAIEEGAVRFQWHRALRLDASMALPGGRSLGILRFGHTSDRTGAAKRVRNLLQGPLPGALLILMPDPVRLRHAQRLLARAPVRVFLAVEGEAVGAEPESSVWHPPTIAADLGLRYVLTHLRPGGIVPAEPWHRKVLMPGDLALGDGDAETPQHLLTVLLKPAEKRTLDLVFDWPWVTSAQVAGMLGVNEERVLKVLARLGKFGLVAESAIEGMRRLTVTDRGLAWLGRRDRTLISVLRDRWGATLRDTAASHSWRDVAGRVTRQLLRNLEHTDAVYGFMAKLAVWARSQGWEVVQMDPAFRASRYFSLHGHRYAVHPDAFGLLRQPGRDVPFFLEWERRAVRPVIMAERLAPYLRYFATRRPTDDHGARPELTVILPDAVSASHFQRAAQAAMRRSRIVLPLRIVYPSR